MVNSSIHHKDCLSLFDLKFKYSAAKIKKWAHSEVVSPNRANIGGEKIKIITIAYRIHKSVVMIFDNWKPKNAWKQKQTKTHKPRYWKGCGNRLPNGFSKKAMSGIESEKIIEVAISLPKWGFKPIGKRQVSSLKKAHPK